MNEGRPGEIAKVFRHNPNTGKREFGNLVVVRATSDSNTRPQPWQGCPLCRLSMLYVS